MVRKADLAIPSHGSSKPGIHLQLEPKGSSPAAASSQPQDSAIMAPKVGVTSKVTPARQATPAPAQKSCHERRPDEAQPGKERFHEPKLRLEIRDLRHPGAKAFLDALQLVDCFSEAVTNVQRLLYFKPACPTTTLPTTRSVTLILRDMGGVAYTTGSDLDDDHKEIHLSLSYIAKQPATRCCDEITGVLTHELVHCYQYNAYQTCPGGLIEGIADWVRLRCNLCPPHWKPSVDGGWDKGYDSTAYFLEYLERRFGDGTVRRMNEKLRLQRYHEKHFWVELVGRPVDGLWQDYCSDVKKDKGLDRPYR